MAYSHSFSADFYGDVDSPTITDRPTNVVDALVNMPQPQWEDMARNHFECLPEYLDIETVLAEIESTDTVSNLDSPVTVWIDPDGWYTVDVFDAD